ncbi:MAG: hypothetical protein JNM69_42405 [Archangium sp.]|nr:hypothetical protein [Archangium sp.]
MRALVLILVTGCASSGVIVTRQASGAVLTVDLERLPETEAERTGRLSELAAETCGASPAHVTSQKLATRDEVQLDLDRVVTSVQRRPATSAWAPAPSGQTVFNARSTIPPTPPASDERATHVAVPVMEVVVVCGG